MSPAPGQSDDTLATLLALWRVCQRCEAGFRSCASQSQAEDVRALLRRRAEECKGAALELQTHVQRLDKLANVQAISEDGAATAWNASHTTLASHTDAALLEVCEREEDAALESYTDALSKRLGPAAREAIEKQRREMRRQHELLRTLRDHLRGLDSQTS